MDRALDAVAGVAVEGDRRLGGGRGGEGEGEGGEGEGGATVDPAASKSADGWLKTFAAGDAAKLASPSPE